MDPLTMSLIGGVVSGISGSLFEPRLPKDLKKLLRMQISIAKELRQRAHSVPLSDPLEQAALAQDRGLLGEQQRGSQQQLFAQNGMANAGNQNDMMLNLNQQQTGQSQLVNTQHLLAALQSRQGDLMNAGQVAARGAATYPQGLLNQQDPTAAAFGNLAQLIAYRNAQQKPGTGQTQTQSPPGGALLSPTAASPYGLQAGFHQAVGPLQAPTGYPSQGLEIRDLMSRTGRW